MRMKTWVALSALTLTLGAVAPFTTRDVAAKVKPELPLYQPTCGESVIQSFRLAGNMSCPTTALYVYQPGITIDLNQRTIAGANIGDGVAILASSVRVSNGTIRDYSHGVQVFGDGPGSKLSKLSLVSNVTGVSVHAHQTRIASTTVTHGAYGIGIYADSSTVRNSSVSHTTSVGIAISGSNNAIINTSAVGNYKTGIQIYGAHNLASKNAVIGNGHGTSTPGLELLGPSSKNRIQGNRFIANGNDGYRDSGTGNVARDNLARGNGFFQGVANGVGTGIDATAATTPKGSGNRSHQNDASIGCVPATLCK